MKLDTAGFHEENLNWKCYLWNEPTHNSLFYPYNNIIYFLTIRLDDLTKALCAVPSHNRLLVHLLP